MPKGREKERYSPDLITAAIERIYTPQEGELEREFTPEELTTLCKQKKCCVEMYRWNPVNEFYHQLKRRGKLNNKAPQKIQRILKKVANRYKNDPERTYSREYIEEKRKWEWEMRKCFNGRWLDENKENSNVSETTSDRRSSLSSCITIIRSQTPIDDVVDVEQPHVPNYMKHIFYDALEIEGQATVILDTERNTEENEKGSTADEPDSLNQLGDEVLNIIGSESINTIITQSEPTMLFQTESENYESFHHSIPVTSTQSQSQDHNSA